MRNIVTLCCILLLFSVNACDKMHSPPPDTTLSGIWRGRIDSMLLVMLLSQTEEDLQGEVLWQVADPAYMTNLLTTSHVDGDSIFLYLTSTLPSQPMVFLSGEKKGATMSGVYRRLDISVPLSDTGTWKAEKDD